MTPNNFPAFSGSVDGTNDKTIWWQNGTSSLLSISRNQMLNLSSGPVGLTDTQTLTNKVLTSPTISGPTLSGTITGTYTIGGTPTFPSSVVTLTSAQTLTNKTLTGPTINSPTITNASITADSLAGYSTSNSGTIYGMSVVSGILASAALTNTVNTAALQTNAVGFSNLLSTIFSGQVQNETNTGTGAGTMYYINLGGIKLLWATSQNVDTSTTSTGNVVFNLPGFFSSIQTVIGVAANMTAEGTQVAAVSASSISQITFNVFTTASTGTSAVSMLVVGT